MRNDAMLGFMVKRLLYTVPVLFVAVTLLFGLTKAIPSNPLNHGQPLGQAFTFEHLANPATPARKRKFGLDKPWYDQYFHYLGSLVRLDFGRAFIFGGGTLTVNDIIRQQGSVTLELMLLAFGWALVLGIPLAVVAAARHGTIVDRAITAIGASTLGLPSFFVATVLLWLLSLKLGLVPTFGWAGFRAKLLPSFVLSLVPFALITRVLRAELLEVRERDYVRAARAKGLRRGRVLRVHVLRPTLIPIVAMLGPLLGQLVSGMFVIEYIFDIPGIGRYFIASSEVGDYPLTLGLTVVLTAVIALANVAADVALAFLDPRTRTT